MPLANGDRIRQLRQAKGWKSGEFAELVGGIQRNNLINVECNLRPASIELLNRIARVLEVAVTELLRTDSDEDASRDPAA
jgi:transcriptional regulator with XRE-family HTH domain